MPTVAEEETLIGKYGTVTKDTSGSWYLRTNRGKCFGGEYYSYYAPSLILREINDRLWFKIRYMEANP